jgi:hypothetical protein
MELISAAIPNALSYTRQPYSVGVNLPTIALMARPSKFER